jgi:putative ABC transport system ATP-binding protein
MALFQEMHQSGITVVFVTHEPDIAEYTQRVVRFRDGQVVDDERIAQKKACGEAA